MAETNNTIETVVKLDATSAQQEIIKLNAVASDGTKEVSERLEAKNKQVKIQNDLSKQTISDAKKKLDALKKANASQEEIEKAQKKLNQETLKATKLQEAGVKQQNKLNESLKKGQGATNKLDNATGGFITRLKLLAANPIVLVITALVGSLKLLKEAFTSSEEGQNRWAKAVAVVNTLLGNLLDLVADFSEMLVNAILKPEEAWKSFINSLKTGFEILKVQVFDRFVGKLKILSGNFEKGILKMRKAWNEFTGDAEDVEKIEKGIEAVNKKIQEGVEAQKKANTQITDFYKKSKKAITDFVKEQEKEAGLSAKVADMRAKADLIERKLIVDRSLREADIAKLRLKAREEDKFTAEERKKALEEALRLGNSLLDQETEYLTLRKDAQILENTFSRSNKENLDAEAKATAAVNNKITERANLQRQIQREALRVAGQIKTQKAKDEKEAQALIDKEIKAEEERKAKEQEKLDEEAALNQRKRDAKIALREEEIKDLEIHGENTLEAELALLKMKEEQELSQAGLLADEKLAIQQKYANNAVLITKAQKEAEQELVKQQAEAGISALAEAFGFAKEVALAQMLIAAPQAIGDSFKNAAKAYPAPLSLAMGALGAAATIVPIVKAVSDIKSTNVRNPKGGTRSSGGSASVSRPAATAGVSSIENIAASNSSRLGTNSELNSRATADASNNVSGSTQSNVVFSENNYQKFQSQIKFKEDQTTLS